MTCPRIGCAGLRTSGTPSDMGDGLVDATVAAAAAENTTRQVVILANPWRLAMSSNPAQ